MIAAVQSARPASVPFQSFVLLHIICAVGGFGAVAYRSLVLDLARRRGAAAAAGVLAVYGQISQVGEVLVYGALLFGLAAVAAGPSGISFAKPWVGAALGVYIVMVGVLHGLVRPAERRYRRTMLELAQMPAMAPPKRPPQLAELDSLYRRIGVGMGIFNVCLIGALYLMVFKP
ncbi:MAG TPA: hypothetical protein VMS00_08230 [Acidimicrobiales bacterium]|nr:hypothetical protein [Acidimicrobiales bacterium]